MPQPYKTDLEEKIHKQLDHKFNTKLKIMSNPMQDIKQQFVKDFQARYEIHPQELGQIADFWLEKLSLAVEQEKEQINKFCIEEIEYIQNHSSGNYADGMVESLLKIKRLINNK